MSSIYTSFGFNRLANWMQENRLEVWAELLPAQIAEGLSIKRYGDLPSWLDALNAMPSPIASDVTGDAEITVNCPNINASEREQLMSSLQALIPWRKGPFRLCDIHIDTEWRSDWKWDRLREHISPLEERLVLDVGCGNGYHMWRMLEDGAKRVIGVDPSPRFSVQFEMVKRLAGSTHPVDLVPVPLEAIPRPVRMFDTVFSMGVIYHRKNHMEHLQELKDCLRPGGELVLESLVIEGKDDECLVPESRYAKMRNVWAVPTSGMMQTWLRESGFLNVRLIDESVTTIDEQRATDWMRFESLPNFLDPNDRSKTVEGYPAPRRAILIAEAPG